MISLGIDAGGSSTRWLLLDEDGIIASGKTDSFSGLFYTKEEKRINLTILESLLETVLKQTKPDVVVAGVTAFSSGETEKPIKEMFATKLDLAEQNILIKNDMYIAYRNAFKLGEGILIYAGTGSIAYYIDENQTMRAGGRGYLIDDAGGGYWIGKEALKYVLRIEDMGAKSVKTELAKQVYDSLGTRDWPKIKELVYSGGRKKLASLAPAVSVAATNDDFMAKMIFQNAGTELSRLANALQVNLEDEKPVAFAGGISRAHPSLTESLKSALKGNSDFWVVETEAVEAAAKLGLELISSQ